jgi:hypothetical protein
MEVCFSDREFITIDDKIVGVNLGYDFTTEHECGIKQIREAFGIKREEPGFEGLVNTKIPPGLYLRRDPVSSKDNSAALVYVPRLGCSQRISETMNTIEMIIKNKLYSFSDDGVSSAWSEDDFGVRVRKEYGYVLENLLNAFIDKQGIIMFGGQETPFGNRGLLLVDYSKIPTAMKDEFRQIDIAARDEQAMYRRLEQESGVYKLLEKAGKTWNYLHVDRLDEEGKPLWWLNPAEQRIHQYGWYHTDDLKLWADDKGPIMQMRRS